MLKRVKEINSQIRISLASQQDSNSFIEVFNKNYKIKKTNEYFQWQFFNSAFPTELIVAYHNDLFVGCYGLQFRKLSTPSDAICAVAIDLLISEEYRKRGIFILLEDYARERALLQNAVAITALSNVWGMKAHIAMPNWRLAGKVLTMELNRLNYSQEAGENDFKEIDYFAQANLVYFESSFKEHIWRFEKNPIYKYKTFAIGNSTITVKIFRDLTTQIQYGDIVDYKLVKSDLRCLIELFLVAIEYLLGSGVAKITTWVLPHHPLRRIIENLGFIESAQERYFCVKVLQDRYSYLYDFTNWHLVEADSEIY